MTRIIAFAIIPTLLLLSACEGKRISFANKKKPACYLQEEFKNIRWIDLSRKIGDSIIVERDGITTTITFEYDRKTKSNTISQSGKGVLAAGRVTKYQDVYFVNTEQDSVYQLAAFVYDKKETISGITEFEIQQGSLHKMISAGYDDDLIIKQFDKHFILETDKKKLLKLYSTLLLEYSPWAVQ